MGEPGKENYLMMRERYWIMLFTLVLVLVHVLALPLIFMDD